jgi:hypothetical protein
VDISVIIVNYRTPGLLKQCIRGFDLVHIKLSYEIIVIDNNSGDGSKDMIAEHFPNVTYISSPSNVGLAKAINAGIKKSQGDFILIVNPDIAVLDGAVEKLYNFLQENPKAALVAPRLVNPDGTTQLSCYKFPSRMVPVYRRTPLGRLPWARNSLQEYLMLDWDHNNNRTVDWVLGASMLIRKSAIDQVGLMDERFFLYFEDVDWCRRFWEQQWEVHYIADAKMVHYHQRLSAESPGLSGIFSKATRIHILSGIKYFMKYFDQRKKKEAAQDAT